MHLHRIMLALGGLLLGGSGAFASDVDYSLRGSTDVSFSAGIAADLSGELHFDLAAEAHASSGGQFDGGLADYFAGEDGGQELAPGGGSTSPLDAGLNGVVAPTPSAALLGLVGLTGVGCTRRRWPKA